MAEPLLVFPHLDDATAVNTGKWPLSKLLDIIHQILEVSLAQHVLWQTDLCRSKQGLETMHKHRIAHLVCVHTVPVIPRPHPLFVP